MIQSPRAGYTLPVFACAAAVAALRWLQQPQPLTEVSIDLLEPPITVEIPIEQVAGLQVGKALAITRSDPGDNLDLTRHTPVWAMVEVEQTTNIPPETVPISIRGGEGIGRQGATGEAAIYRYARRLLLENLERWRQPQEVVRVTLILPEGRSLAERTSSAAFGIVEGLSLLGTSGIAQALSAPGQLEAFRAELQQKASQFETLVFCIGENGLALAQTLGIDRDRLVKTANWLGPLLAEAGMQQVKGILLFGYHGKLIKLAGGIFHTHHYVADARQEILTALGVRAGLPLADLQTLLDSPTAEDGLTHLRTIETATGLPWVERVYGSLVETIDQRTEGYIRTHSQTSVQVGTVLFDRQRQIIMKSKRGHALLEQVC